MMYQSLFPNFKVANKNNLKILNKTDSTPANNTPTKSFLLEKKIQTCKMHTFLCC